jgi:hypothetical protein
VSVRSIVVPLVLAAGLLAAVAVPAPAARAQTFTGSGADIKVGGNNTNEGTPELVVYDADDASGGYVTWDANLGDGFDTTWVPFTLTADVYGNVSLTVKGVTTTSTVAGPSAVDLVVAKASVDGGERFAAFQGLVINWYYLGDLQEQLTIAAGRHPVVNTIGVANPPPNTTDSEVYAPEGFGYDAIQITGEVRLRGTATTLPPPAAMFGQFLFYGW